MAEVRVDPLSGLRTIISDTGWNPSPLAPAPVAPPREPALDPASPEPAGEANRDLFWAGPARGAYEVIAHGSGVLGDLSAPQVIATLEGWRERMTAHSQAAAVHVSARRDSASAQLFALDFVPATLARERERFGAYATRTMGANLLGDLLQEEVRRRVRVVAVDDEAVALSAFAAPTPYRLLIVPRRPRPRFSDAGPTGAGMLHGVLGRLAARLGPAAPVDLWVRTAPRGAEHFCWRVELAPAFGSLDGLAAGTGVHINPVAPERAAAELRELSV